jgi:N-acetylmuramoyl-L-alanine amidase
MAKKIYLSPSNQNGNLYAYGNTNEMEQCNRIADAAKTALERCGFTVKKAPKGQNMNVSINESNSWGADLHMPIHTNAANGKCGGTLCMVYSKASENMKYANPIYKNVQAVTPGKTEYGIRESPELAELNATNAIAVYTEVDFHDNPTIAKWLIENPSKVGEALCKGVCEAFGVTYKAPGSAASTASKTTAAATVSDRDKFLNKARSYIGSNGYFVCKTKLGLDAVYDWCCFAVSAIMKDCGFIPKYQPAVYGVAPYPARFGDGKTGTWFAKGSKTPQPGDLIFFKYDGCPTQDKYSCSHIGIVESVSGNTVTTLEGNVDGYGSDWASTSTFKRKTRYLSDGSVHSFFRPNWAAASTPKTTTQTASGTIYRVQVGAFSDKKNADAQLKKLQSAGYKDAMIVEVKK